MKLVGRTPSVLLRVASHAHEPSSLQWLGVGSFSLIRQNDIVMLVWLDLTSFF